ncbi:hypothetical protein [Vibrio mimicus]|uniref:Uncharacterized protein n=1 Tax=Vibrio mimicus VM603 TaxID=671074 RepID=D2YF75_VIBMI|nr:hypothetical protein [Vibrio mimicus]EEW06593.1 conserved hypothetical protein [Vibrio mimicus VM603]
MLRSFINTLLALLFFIACFLFFLADAVAQEVSCQIGIESGDRHWSGTVFGDAPYICTPSSSGGLCRYDLKGVSLCFVATAECVGNFISTGQACNWDDSAGLKQGGQTVYPDYSAPPDKPWDPNNPSLPLPKKVENVINQMPSNVEHGVDEAKAYRSLAQIEGFGVLTLDELLIRQKETTEEMHTVTNNTRRTFEGVDTLKAIAARIEDASIQDSGKLGSIDNWLRIINEKMDSGTGGSGLPDKQFSDLMGGIGSLHSSIYNANNTTASAVRDVRDGLRPIEFELKDIGRTLESMGNSLTANSNSNTDKLLEAINGLGGTGGGSDLSGVQSGIDAINTGLDNLNGLLNGNGLNKPSTGSGVNFGEVPLYGSEALEGLNTEITDLQKEYSEKIKDFQKLFSFDISKLNNGEYKEHSLSFIFANGQKTSVTSSVFPALVSNAGLISSVILFLAALAGLRIVMGGGDK